MTTKTIQARHLSVSDSLVEGGDGKRRVALKISELSVTPNEVMALVTVQKAFERRYFNPRARVRVLVDA